MVAGHANPFESFSKCIATILPNNVIYLLIFHLFLMHDCHRNAALYFCFYSCKYTMHFSIANVCIRIKMLS